MTSSGSDLAGNPATGTEVQEFVYSSGSLYTTAFSDDFNRTDNTNVITGSTWTSESDSSGLGAIVSNKYQIALNGEGSTYIEKTITGSPNDYQIATTYNIATVVDADLQGNTKSVEVAQLRCVAGITAQVLFVTNIGGYVINIKVTYNNDAGVAQTPVITPYAFSAGTDIPITITVDAGEAGTSDGILKVMAGATTICDLTGLDIETRFVLSAVRTGMIYREWNQNNTLTVDNYSVGTK